MQTEVIGSRDPADVTPSVSNTYIARFFPDYDRNFALETKKLGAFWAHDNVRTGQRRWSLKEIGGVFWSAAALVGA